MMQYENIKCLRALMTIFPKTAVIAIALSLLAFVPRYFHRSPVYQNDFLATDAAFLMVWARQISEAETSGITRDFINTIYHHDEIKSAEVLLSSPPSLMRGVFYGLIETDKIHRLLDACILASWIKLAGFSVHKSELLMVLMSTLTVVCVYFIGVLLWNDVRIALLAGFLAAFLKGSVVTSRWVSWHLMGQSLYCSAILMGLILLKGWMRNSNPYVLLATGLIFGMTMYAIPSPIPHFALFVIAVLIAQLSFQKYGCEGKKIIAWKSVLKASFIYLSGVMIAYAPALVFIFMRKFAVYDAASTMPVDETISIVKLFQSLFYDKTISSKMFFLIKTWMDYVSLPVLILTIVGAWVIIRSENIWEYILLGWVAFYVLLSAFLGSSAIQARSVLICLPALALLGAKGAAFIIAQSIARWKFIATIGVLLICCNLIYETVKGTLLLPAHNNERWRLFAAIAPELKPDSLILTNYPLDFQLFLPNLKDYTVIDSNALRRHYEKDKNFSEYIRWRYPKISSIRRCLILEDASAYGGIENGEKRAMMELELKALFRDGRYDRERLFCEKVGGRLDSCEFQLKHDVNWVAAGNAD